MDRGRYDHLSYDQIHELYERRGTSRQDSKEVSKTRSAAMDAEESKRTLNEDDAAETSVTVTGKRGRVPVDVAGNLDRSPRSHGKRCRVDDLHFASVVDKEEVKAHGQWRNPKLVSRSDATQVSAVEGVGATTSAWEGV